MTAAPIDFAAARSQRLAAKASTVSKASRHMKIREVAAELRDLASPAAERMNDQERLKAFVLVAVEAADMLDPQTEPPRYA